MRRKFYVCPKCHRTHYGQADMETRRFNLCLASECDHKAEAEQKLCRLLGIEPVFDEQKIQKPPCFPGSNGSARTNCNR